MITLNELRPLKPGDQVTRWINAGGKPARMMRMRVTRVDDQHIHCGDWKFDLRTGAEIDEELGFNTRITATWITADDA